MTSADSLRGDDTATARGTGERSRWQVNAPAQGHEGAGCHDGLVAAMGKEQQRTRRGCGGEALGKGAILI